MRVAHAQESFHFLKITDLLLFFENLHISSIYFKEHSPKRKYEMRISFILYLKPPKLTKLFLTYAMEKKKYTIAIDFEMLVLDLKIKYHSTLTFGRLFTVVSMWL